MAAFRRGHRAFAPALDHACGRHLGIAEKAVEPHFPGADTPGQPPQADILARNHAFDERRPPLSRRRSPNRPNDQSICASMSTPPQKPKCRNKNHMDCRFWNPLPGPRVNLSHQMCACPSAFAGTTMEEQHSRDLRGHCERSEAIHSSFFAPRDGLLRGACHRARIRATRWLYAEHDRQLGGESPLSSLMVAKD